jgi:hypothetical protein
MIIVGMIAAMLVAGFWCSCVLGAEEDERSGWK